jgi:MFS family permease
MAAAHRYQLHLLLRNHLLRAIRYQQPLHHHHHRTCFSSLSDFLLASRQALTWALLPLADLIQTNVVNVVCTVPGILMIDRAGRRNMLLAGAVVMCICEYLVAIVGVTVGSSGSVAEGTINLTAQRVLIAFVCIYIAAFASTWGPIAWVVTGEIFPLAIRGKAMSMSVASNWLWNFAIGYATPYLVNPTTTGVNGVKAANLGVKVFFIWGSTCLGCFLFTYFFVSCHSHPHPFLFFSPLIILTSFPFLPLLSSGSRDQGSLAREGRDLHPSRNQARHLL